MNIVVVSSYDCFYPGGVGEHIRSLSAALRRRGVVGQFEVDSFGDP
jgi:hypothetical protein